MMNFRKKQAKEQENRNQGFQTNLIDKQVKGQTNEFGNQQYSNQNPQYGNYQNSYPNQNQDYNKQQFTGNTNQNNYDTAEYNPNINNGYYNGQQPKQINWNVSKLNILKEKLIDSSYYSGSFFTYSDNYEILDFVDVFNSKQNKSEIIKMLVEEQKQVVIDTRYDRTYPSSAKRCFNLMQTSRADYGVSTLKLGWPFAIGKVEILKEEKIQDFFETNPKTPQQQSPDANQNLDLKDSKFFYAPFLLWPLKMHTKDRKIFNVEIVKKYDNLLVEVNSHFILSVVHNNQFFDSNEVEGVNIDSFVKVLYSHDTNEFLNNIVQTYERFGLNFSENTKSVLRDIITGFKVEETVKIKQKEPNLNQKIQKTFGELSLNELRLLPFATIGNYPIANVSLYVDYVKMLRTDGVDFVDKIDNTFYNQLDLAEGYHKYFSEKNLKEIVKLDFSQKKACNVALTDNLIISGAAGNGKSQTISSIVANSINNSKSVLFSTEKKEAANVIFNRLGRLRNYSLKLFESDSFSKDVTTQLKNGLERVSLVYGIRNTIIANSKNSKNVVSERLDNLYSKVNEFKTVMMSEDGQNYPEYIFKKNLQKDELKEVIKLVGPILKYSESSSEFWSKINKIYDDFIEFQQIDKVRENLEISEDLFVQAFNLVKYYDGNTMFFDNYLVQYALNKQVDESVETISEETMIEFLEAKETVNITEYQQDSKALYWALHKLFQSLDDYSIDILKSHDVHWYNTVSNSSKQKSTELVVEFKEKYSPDEFDYQFFSDYYVMEKFAADHGDVFQVDNENYYEMIDNLITNKLGEDIKTTEFLFALKVTKALKDDPKLAQSFNQLYALIKNTDAVYSIEDVLVTYSNIISLVFPLILGSPSMIAKYIVCQKGIFDICIIDEASMIPLEDAFSLLYRSKQWIVSGDMKQLPPTSYQKNIEKYNKYQSMQVQNYYNKFDSDELNELMRYKIFETPVSLLEYIGTKIQTVTLEYHYRSVKKELFEFSNIVFYKKRIHVADDQKEKDAEIATGINLLRSYGYAENGINRKEAEEVIRLVEKIVSKPDHGSIGIITTTNEQRDYIENLLLEHPSKLVTNELSRISDDGEDSSIFVLTCEKVQGSERDNIIISFVASHDAKNKENVLSINNTLGLLTTEVGPNYLNVLITRSRHALFLVTSFDNDEIITDNNESLMILKDYLEYAKLLTENGHDLNDPRVQSIFKPYIKNNAVIDFSNDMRGRNISRVAPDLKEDLEQLFAYEPRLEILNGWYEGDVKIDLVIRDKKTKRNILGILCDEFIYDVMLNGKQRDFYNRKFLETRNWKFISLSSLQWSKVYKRRGIIDSIINSLTLHLNNWKEALRITKLPKYQVDENGNVVISESVIKNSKNRLAVIEVDGPVHYEGDDYLLLLDKKQKLSSNVAKTINVVAFDNNVIEDKPKVVRKRRTGVKKTKTKKSTVRIVRVKKSTTRKGKK